MSRTPLIIVQVNNPALSVTAPGFTLLSQLIRIQLSRFDIRVICSPEVEPMLHRAKKAGFQLHTTELTGIEAVKECLQDTEHTDVILLDDSRPLVDPYLVQKVFNFQIGGSQQATICTRLMPGTEIECVSRETLLSLDCMPGDTSNLHVKEFLPHYEYQYHFRVALEDYNDLLFLRVLFSFLGDNPGTLDVTNFLRQHRELCKINRRPMISVVLEENPGWEDREHCFNSLSDQKFQSFEVVPDGPDQFMALMQSPIADKVSSEIRGQYRFHMNTRDKLTPDALQILFNEIGRKASVTFGWFECNSNLEVVKEKTDTPMDLFKLESIRPYRGKYASHINKPLCFVRGVS